jgi:hypothetical protein
VVKSRPDGSIRLFLSTAEPEGRMDLDVAADVTVSCGLFTVDASINYSARFTFSAQSTAEDEGGEVSPTTTLFEGDFGLRAASWSLEAAAGRGITFVIEKAGLLYPRREQAVIISRTERIPRFPEPRLWEDHWVRLPLRDNSIVNFVRLEVAPDIQAWMVAAAGLVGTAHDGRGITALLLNCQSPRQDSCLALFVDYQSQERSDVLLRHLLPAALEENE